jgi:RNA polymerase sigma-70 factor, ECF subfamily
VTDPNNLGNSGSKPGLSGSTSLSLLEGLKLEDQEAWGRFAALYGPLVYHWCRRAGLPPEDAEDVIQEVFLTVAARVAEFHRDRRGDTFRGWLRTITRHKLGDWLRREKTQERAVGGERGDPYLWEAAWDSGESSDSAETIKLYHRALDLIQAEFNPDNWQAFWRIVVENQSPADVAAEFGMTRNAVYLAKSRILRRLREVLGDV